VQPHEPEALRTNDVAVFTALRRRYVGRLFRKSEMREFNAVVADAPDAAAYLCERPRLIDLVSDGLLE
jgi:hypothetical protein